jgi:hypothetical protein
LLSAGTEIHASLGGLMRARATARANVRVAPRRWRLREMVDRENDRTLQLQLVANTVLGLIRAVSVASGPRPAPLTSGVVVLADALGTLGATAQPWPDALRVWVHGEMDGLIAAAAALEATTAIVILGAAAGDLVRLVI